MITILTLSAFHVTCNERGLFADKSSDRVGQLSRLHHFFFRVRKSPIISSVYILNSKGFWKWCNRRDWYFGHCPSSETKILLRFRRRALSERTNCGGPFEMRQTFWLARWLISTACETPAKMSVSCLSIHRWRHRFSDVLVAFALQKACSSFRLSIPMEQLRSYLTDFYEILYLSICKKNCLGNSSFIKIRQEWRVLYMKTNTHFWSYLAHLFLGMGNISDKIYREYQNTHFMLSSCFSF